jgi:SAM-dependent methyltransferase
VTPGLDRHALAFAEAWLPPAPARVLEIGCGEGDLAAALTDRGYDVIGVDPRAPAGSGFRQVRIEDLGDEGLFDAAIAVVSLHHLADPEAAARDLATRLRPDGRLVVLELVRELLAGPTASWFHLQQRARAAIGRREAVSESFDAWFEAFELKLDGHGVHSWARVRAALVASFAIESETPAPYLYRWGLDREIEPLEQQLIDDGDLAALGVRWVGVRRP